MSTKRRADQEKRKKLYDEDNFVGLNVNNDDGDFLPNQDKKVIDFTNFSETFYKIP